MSTRRSPSREYPRSPAAALGVLLVLAAACGDDAPTDPQPTRPDPARLETTELLSGGTGLLTSSAFDRLDVEPEADSTGAPVADRWKNLRVLVGGRATDVRRVDAERMEFDVPVLPAGTYGVDVEAVDASASLSVTLRGVVASDNVSLSSGCSFSRTLLLSVADEVLIGSRCSELSGVDPPAPEIVGRQGYATFRPTIAGSGVRWIEGLYVDDESPRSYWIGPGPSTRPGHFVAHQPGPDSQPPDTWIWRAGPNPEPVEPIACLGVADNYSGTVIAEPSPGVCLVYQVSGVDHRTIWRDGVRIATDVEGPVFGDHSFVLAGDGWSALRGPAELLVFDDAANLVVREALDGWVEDVAFGPDGRLIVVYRPLEAGAPNVLQVRNRASGEILDSVSFQRSLEAVSLRGGQIWLASWKSATDETLRIDVYDLDGLELGRSVLISSEYLDFPDFLPSLVGESPVLQVDGFGRASVSGWNSHAGIRTHTVEVF